MSLSARAVYDFESMSEEQFIQWMREMDRRCHVTLDQFKEIDTLVRKNHGNRDLFVRLVRELCPIGSDDIIIIYKNLNANLSKDELRRLFRKAGLILED